MPRYYCDYCDTYLTHDSPSVRKQHNAGYKHKSNVRTYYQQFEEQQSQSLLEQKIKEYQGQNQFQVGATFNQFLQQRPRLPVLPLPILPVGSLFVPGVRPPILPPPVSGVTTGYGASSSVSMAPPGVMPMQMNNMPRPPMLNLPSPAVSSTMANGATSYQAIPSFSSTASSGASNTLEGFAYSQNAGSNH